MNKISRVFIANRGEIAGRIALAAKKYGLESVCIFSGKEPPGYLAGLVSEFIRVEEESPALYLSQEQMIAHARESSCDALHPGFGFLSENAGFAAKVKQAGLTWIGPDSEAIAAMASKSAARQLAMESQVPCLPGLKNVDSSSSLGIIEDFTAEHGFPILLKAALGGGGKGMRVVRRPEELSEAMQRASSEALNAFGDPSLIVEKFLENPRHVEVQILGDQHGHVICMGDRDCSLQRRHQKIIEEAPAPFLRRETREGMHEAALSLAKKVKYHSAGTVEFLVETNPDGSQKFYFLEMNTRLQVEHPVTEEVFGCDLVGWQFKIAEGASIESLRPKAQGHSVEARIYAEDPAQDFFPSPGKVYAFHPHKGPGIRWEIGLDTVDEVTGKFDPMIAKVVCSGRNRDEALDLLEIALNRSVLAGPIHNMEFLAALARNKKFRDDISGTRFIADNIKDELLGIEKKRSSVQALAEQVIAQMSFPNVDHKALELTRNAFSQIPWDHTQRTQTLSYQTNTYPHTYCQAGTGTIQQKGLPIEFVWSLTEAAQGSYYYCKIDGCGFASFAKRLGESASKSGQDLNQIYAPVPGKVIKVLVEPKSEVSPQSTVIILESMKMEFEVKAPRVGTVELLHTTVGQQVDADDPLITLEESKAPS